MDNSVDNLGLIITGGPGTGKTAIAIGLEKRGFRVVHEAAIDIIQYYLAKKIQEPWALPEFEEEIAKLQLGRQTNISLIPTQGPFYLDRTCIDCLAYYLARKKTNPSLEFINLLLRMDFKTFCSSVFFIEGSGSIKNTVYRDESIAEAYIIEKALKKVYQAFGFELISVEFGNLDERVAFIIQTSEKLVKKSPLTIDITNENKIKILNSLFMLTK